MGLLDKLLNEGAKVLKEVTSEENKEKAAEFLSNLKTGVEEKTKEVLSEENKEKASAFFSNLKSEVEEKSKELLSEENKEKVSSFFGNLKESFNEYKEKAVQEEEKKKIMFEQSEEDEAKTCREKILEVMAAEFPQYTVRENVSPYEIGGTGRFMNYSMVIYEGLSPRLFIMIVGKTTTSHREYRWSRQEAEKRGYQFINFVEHYPNTIPYITDRLHRYL